MQRMRWLSVLAAMALLGGCDGPRGEVAGDYPRFSPGGKHDGADQDIRYIQDIGTNTLVRGRFQSDLTWRGFTFFAEQGQQIDASIQAQLEQNGFLIEQQVQTQMLVYGPADSPEALFEQVVADTGMVQQATVELEVAQDGFYLLAATRDQAVQQAQFELEVQCKNCGAPDGEEPAELLCDAGRLYVEGARLKSQEWTKCEVIVLEPTTLPEEETLLIGPDVNVRMHYYITDFHPEGWGETRLTIDGALTMTSEAKHPVVFESHVEGKQWDGIYVRRPKTLMQHFVMRDSHGGLAIHGHEVRVAHAELMLNQTAVKLGEVSGVELEDLSLHDNVTGLDNFHPSPRGGFSATRVSDLFFLDSELYLNEQAVRLNSLTGSYLDGLEVHDNTRGITIRNQGPATEAPEDYVVLSNNVFTHNGFGIDLTGNGVVDGSEFRGQKTYAVATSQGWQKVKNSRFEENNTECVEPGEGGRKDQRWFRDCSALNADSEAHTVYRNNVIEKNTGFGVALLGLATTGNRASVGRDPAILNSVIANNGFNGVAVVDAPVYSIEFNTFTDNGRAAVGAFWSASSRLCSAQHVCPVRRNRLQRNNVEGDYGFIEFQQYLWDGTVFEPTVGRALIGSMVLEASKNFIEEANTNPAVAERFETLDAQQFITLLPLLAEPEETAGLIRPLD